MPTDNSQTNRIHRIVDKTLYSFHKNNPNQYEGGNKTFPVSVYMARLQGQKNCACADFEPFCSSPPGSINNLIITSSNPQGPTLAPYDNFNFFVDFSWDPVPNAIGYTFTTNDTTTTPPVFVYTPGTTNARMYYNGVDNSSNVVDTVITVTVQTPCGSASATAEAYPCFLAGSIVQMADGTTKVIEDVKVGDVVMGAFGETNTVLALHRPLVGSSLMCKINDEHSTTNHHPHISVDKKFYCGNPSIVENNTYNRIHQVLNESGEIYPRMLHGLKNGRVQKLELGLMLKTVEGGKEVKNLETYNLPPETQLYNLVLGGSHTYYVDGYAVTGWPSEEDFNYDTWSPIV
jgi:hypothetical protein